MRTTIILPRDYENQFIVEARKCGLATKIDMPSVERNPVFLVHESELHQESVFVHQLSGDIITNLARL